MWFFPIGQRGGDLGERMAGALADANAGLRVALAPRLETGAEALRF